MTPLRIAIDNMALIAALLCAAWLAWRLEAVVKAWVRKDSR